MRWDNDAFSLNWFYYFGNSIHNNNIITFPFLSLLSTNVDLVCVLRRKNITSIKRYEKHRRNTAAHTMIVHLNISCVSSSPQSSIWKVGISCKVVGFTRDHMSALHRNAFLPPLLPLNKTSSSTPQTKTTKQHCNWGESKYSMNYSLAFFPDEDPSTDRPTRRYSIHKS